MTLQGWDTSHFDGPITLGGKLDEVLAKLNAAGTGLAG